MWSKTVLRTEDIVLPESSAAAVDASDIVTVDPSLSAVDASGVPSTAVDGSGIARNAGTAPPPEGTTSAASRPDRPGETDRPGEDVDISIVVEEIVEEIDFAAGEHISFCYSSPASLSHAFLIVLYLAFFFAHIRSYRIR